MTPPGCTCPAHAVSGSCPVHAAYAMQRLIEVLGLTETPPDDNKGMGPACCLRYDRAADEYVDTWGNRFVPRSRFRRLWESGRLLKGQGQRPTVGEFMAVAEVYIDEHDSGGSLHIVVGDYNLKDSHVEFCYRYALEQGDGYGAALALLLLRMTRSQRGRVAHRWYR